MHIVSKICLLLTFGCIICNQSVESSILKHQQRVRDLPKMCFMPNVCERVKATQDDSAIIPYCKPADINAMLQSDAEKNIELILLTEFVEAVSQEINNPNYKENIKKQSTSEQEAQFRSIKKTVLESYWSLLPKSKRTLLQSKTKQEAILSLDLNHPFQKRGPALNIPAYKAYKRIKKIAYIDFEDRSLIYKYLSKDIILLHLIEQYEIDPNFSSADFIAPLCLEWESKGSGSFGSKSASINTLLTRHQNSIDNLELNTQNKMKDAFAGYYKLPEIDSVFDNSLSYFLSKMIELDNLGRFINNFDFYVPSKKLKRLHPTEKMLYFIKYLAPARKHKYFQIFSQLFASNEQKFLKKVYNLGGDLPDFNAIRYELIVESQKNQTTNQSSSISFKDIDQINLGGSDIGISLGQDSAINSLVAKLLYVNSWIKNFHNILDQESPPLNREETKALFESVQKFQNNDFEQVYLQGLSEYLQLLKNHANYYILSSLRFNESTKDPQFASKFERLESKNMMLSRLENIFNEQSISFRHIPLRSLYLKNMIELLFQRSPEAASEQILTPLLRLKLLHDHNEALLNQAATEAKSDELTDKKEELLAWNSEVRNEFTNLSRVVSQFAQEKMILCQERIEARIESATGPIDPELKIKYQDKINDYIENQVDLLFANLYYTDALLKEVFEP